MQVFQRAHSRIVGRSCSRGAREHRRIAIVVGGTRGGRASARRLCRRHTGALRYSNREYGQYRRLYQVSRIVIVVVGN